jgi:hypothetical protein
MLTPKQQKFKDKWEIQRVQKRKFCFIQGSLNWGLSTAILCNLISYLIDKEPIISSIPGQIVYIMLLFISGYFMGLFFYNSKENSYQNMLKAEKEEEIDDPIIGDEWKKENN